MRFFLFPFILSCISASIIQECFPDSTYICSGCTQSLFFPPFSSSICVGACPSGYLLDSSTATCTLQTSQLLFNTDFSLPTSLSSSSIGDFLAQSTDFQTAGGPVLSKDRGMYFAQNTYLSLDTSPTPAPSLVILMWVRVGTAGTIFDIQGDSGYFTIQASSSGTGGFNYGLSLRICTDPSTCSLFSPTFTSSSLRLPTNHIVWRYLSIQSVQLTSNSFTCTQNIDEIQYSSSTSGVNTIGLSSEIFAWTLGSASGGFEGFVYALSGYNSDAYTDLSLISPPNCGPSFYFENGACYACDSSCTLSPLWCVRGTDCSICYSDQCTSCTGFSSGLCSGEVCPNNCVECSDSKTCTVCDTGYLLNQDPSSGSYCLDNFRVYLMSNWIPQIVTSGSDSATYFQNNPDPDDPIAYPCRGFYFNGFGQYFQSRAALVLPKNFIMYMWVYPIYGDIVTKGTGFTLDSGIYATLIVVNDNTNRYPIFALASNTNTWMYIAIQVVYESTLTTVTTFDGTTTYTFSGLHYYYFRDTSLTAFIIGGGTFNYYQGFLANIGVLSLDANKSYSLSDSLPISFYCGSSLNPCPVYPYTDTTCAESCTDCDTCYDASASDCFLCEYGSYSSGHTCASICPEGTAYYNYFCLPIHGDCFANYAGIACQSCVSPYYLYENLCISVCPSSMTTDSTNMLCTSNTGQIFSLQFGDIIEIANMNGFDFGSDSASQYPSFDANDPVPALGRGYHFTSSSYITSNMYYFGPDLSIAVWIKIDSDGDSYDIFSKTFCGSSFLDLTRDRDTFFTIYPSLDYSNYYIDDPNAIDMTSWQYIQVMMSFDTISLVTTLSTVYNTAISSTLSVSFNFWSDKSYSSFIIGSTSNSGFAGFLYSIEAWSIAEILTDLYSTSCTGASQCPSSSTALGTCGLSSMEDLSCTACQDTCADGCVRSTDCSLCADLLCYYCGSFAGTCITCIDSTPVVAGLCQCSAGFFRNSSNACQSCDATCASCSNALPSGCLSCSGSVLFSSSGACLPASACPTLPGVAASSIPESNTCAGVSTAMVFYLELDSLQDSFYDQISNILITSGADSTFYPSYKTTDPWVAYGRGYYFTSASYLSIDPGTTSALVLGPQFTLGVWVYVVTPGNIFTREAAAISCSISTDLSGYTASVMTSTGNTASTPIVFALGVWHLFEIQMKSISYGNSFITAVDTVVGSISAISYFVDYAASVQTTLGDLNELGFEGFAWSISIYNTWSPLAVSNPAGVVYPIELRSPLSTCLITEFPPACNTCMPSCTHGCTKAINCNLCIDSLCSTCTSFNTCTACVSYAELVMGVCQCTTFYNNDIKGCNPPSAPITCYTNCLICLDSSAAGCTVCIEGFYMVNGYCMLCPTGYSNSTGSCVLNSTTAFSVTFNILQGIIYDSYNSIPVITGSSEAFYPDYDYDDPIATYLQGFYFNGYSSVLRLPQFSIYTGPELVLGPTWTLEMWIMPISTSGCLFSSQSLNGTLLLFCYNETDFLSSVNLTQSPLNTNSFPLTLSLNTWQILRIILSFSVPNRFYVYVNNYLWVNFALSGVIFPNYCTKVGYSIGATPTSFYQGFIFEISIYAQVAPPSRFLQSSECAVAYQGQCLPECAVSQYWVGPGLTACSSCQQECKSCRSGDTCNLCHDSVCYRCSNYTGGSCSQCITNSTNLDQCTCEGGTVFDHASSSCVTCRENQYYNSTECADCPGTCRACTRNVCFSCIENAVLRGGWCYCTVGRNGTDCELAFFGAGLVVLQDNSLIIQFTDPLQNELQARDVGMTTNCSLDPSFNIVGLSKSRYSITISVVDTIPDNCLLNVTFLELTNIVSIYNSLLNTSYITGVLYSSESITPNLTLTAEGEKVSSATTIAMTTITVATISINPNPACLWSFISTIQMLCFIAMSSVGLSPRFAGYLRGLRKYNMFPDIFSYFVSHHGAERPFQRAYDFGYVDDFIIFNSGSYISIFLLMMFLWLVFYILGKFTHKKPLSIGFIKKKIESSLKSYKYDAFLRFWITCYIEIYAAAVIVFSTTSIFIWSSVLNYLFAILITVNTTQVFIVLTPLWFLYFSTKNKNKIAHDEEISVNWGTLFYEFNNDKGHINSLFYFFYFIRRLLYIMIQFALQDYPIVQLTLNFVLSVTVSIT